MRDPKLLLAAVALLALNVVHALDHIVNQDQGLAAVGFIGGFGVGVALIAVVLAAIGSDVAAPYLVIVGFGTAAGFVLVHLAPHWGPVSDPYYDAARVNALSWVVLMLCIGISIAVAMVGVESRRQRDQRATA